MSSHFVVCAACQSGKQLYDGDCHTHCRYCETLDTREELLDHIKTCPKRVVSCDDCRKNVKIADRDTYVGEIARKICGNACHYAEYVCDLMIVLCALRTELESVKTQSAAEILDLRAELESVRTRLAVLEERVARILDISNTHRRGAGEYDSDPQHTDDESCCVLTATITQADV